MSCLHDYLATKNNAVVTVEVCKLCGKKNVYPKSKPLGNSGNKEYLAAHPREFAQPYGRTDKLFRQLYGEAAIKSAQEVIGKRKSKDQVETEAYERARAMEKDFKRKYL